MDKNIFINNRKNLLDKLPNGSVVVLFAGIAPRKSGDETYEYTPNRNFYYLTNDDEPSDILILTKNNNHHSETIFIKPYDEVQAKWVGKTYAKNEITDLSGINNVCYLEQFNDYIQTNFGRGNCNNLYLDLERQGFDEAKTPAQEFAMVIKNKYPNVNIINVYPEMAALRMVKCEAEIAEMKNAIEVTKAGIEVLMSQIGVGVNEKHLQAYFEFALKLNGSEDIAFKTIAASGVNSCILHYNANNNDLYDHDLILLDLGAQFNYYKADITRTFPVNGKFSDRQKLIYNIVLEGQKLVFDHIKPGITTRELNVILINFYAIKLKEIGLIKEDSEVSKYYFHGVSHHLGLDTHDATNASPLKTGNVITVEPGLYIEEEKIGIRIEDDVYVTEDGYINLSSEIIKTVDDIEHFMSQNNIFLKK